MSAKNILSCPNPLPGEVNFCFLCSQRIDPQGLILRVCSRSPSSVCVCAFVDQVEHKLCVGHEVCGSRIRGNISAGLTLKSSFVIICGTGRAVSESGKQM